MHGKLFPVLVPAPAERSGSSPMAVLILSEVMRMREEEGGAAR